MTNATKTVPEPALRPLSEDDCARVTGGGTRSSYYSYYSGTSTSYTSNSDGKTS